MSDLMTALGGLEAAEEGHVKAKMYFEGTQPEVFASPKLRRALGKTGTSWRLNFARVPVTSVLDRLEILSVTSPDNRAAVYLQELLANNDFGAESDDTHRWSLVYGEGYVIVWPDEDGEVEIAYNSPLTTRVFYDPEHPKRKLFAAKVFKQREKVRVNLYYPDRIEKYISKGEKPKQAEDFEQYYDHFETAGEVYGTDLPDGTAADEPVAVWPIENPWNEIPVFHFRTERPYGRPEHADAYSPQDMINKLVITAMATNDFHGFPQRYALVGGASGEDAEEFDDEFDTIVGEEGDEHGVPSAEGNSTLRSGPGELWWLEGDKLAVGQFDAAEPSVFLEPLREYVKAMAALTSTPVHHFEGMGQPPSGESLRVAEGPHTKKVGDRKQNFETTWKQVFDFALRIGLDLPDDAEIPEVSLTWAPHESYDNTDSWAVTKAKQEAGVPRSKTLTEQGYSEPEVEKWLGGTEMAHLERLAELSTEFADAAQRLAVAVETGVLTQEQAGAILAPIAASVAAASNQPGTEEAA